MAKTGTKMVKKNKPGVGGNSKVVEHCYHDFLAGEGATTDSKQENLVHASGPGGDPPFPVRLHFALRELKADGLDHMISWQPHGRCFIVHRPKDFAEKVLSLYFRMSKFSSFQRQLNLYGFKRLTHGPDKGGYYHELFLRGMPELAARIIRTTVKNKGPRKAASPDTEPNLYSYSALPDDDALQKTAMKKTETSAPKEQIQPPPPVSPSNKTTVPVPSNLPRHPDAGGSSLLMLASLVTASSVRGVAPPAMYQYPMVGLPQRQRPVFSRLSLGVTQGTGSGASW